MKPGSRRPDPAQQKARRQKIILGVAACALVILLAIEAPKLMHHGKSAAATAAAAAAATPATSTLPGGETTTDSAQPAAAPVVPTRLPNESGASASDGQLVSFSLLHSKDPFRQQLNDSGQPTTGQAAPTTPPTQVPPTSTSATTTTPTSAPTPAPTTPTPTPTPTATSPTTTSPTPTTTSTTTTPAAPTPPPPPAKPAKPTSATISVNGVSEKVAVGASFPAAQPLFRLVAITPAGVAQIGVDGGTLQGSSQSVPLAQGKTLTLMNTADGMRYVLKLVSVS